MPLYRETFGPMVVGEIQRYTFTFADLLAFGESLESAEVTAVVVSGLDNDPDDTIVGSATISGTNVTQRVEAIKAGVIYSLVCEVVTSADQTLKRTGLLAILPQDESTALCSSFSISPRLVNTTAAAGSQVVTITGNPAGCDGGDWTAIAQCDWDSVSPTSGSGPRTVTVSWEANVSGDSRVCTVVIAGNTFTINQAGISIGTPIWVTMIGGGGGGAAGGVDLETIAGGGGAGEFLRRIPLTFTGQVPTLGAGGAGGNDDAEGGVAGQDTTFGILTARGGGRGRVGFRGIGAGNISSTAGAPNTLLGTGQWSGANGGGPAVIGGGDCIVNPAGNSTTISGGSGGIDEDAEFSAVGAGGAASPWGAGGDGGNCNGVEDVAYPGYAATATHYGAGGGGGASTATNFGIGGSGANGYILIELS